MVSGTGGRTAIAEILRGKLSPSGKLPISIEEKLEDNPCYENYHENMKGRELRSVEYREGVFMGYRGYDKTGVKPLFPFGFGLSYSTFEYSGLTLEKTGNNEVKSCLQREEHRPRGGQGGGTGVRHRCQVDRKASVEGA